MERKFCDKKFQSLLISGTLTTVIQYLLILSDTIVIGNILGEQELAAVNVVKVFHSFAIFVSSLISIGTSVFYSYEIGNFNKDKANRLFGQGIILAIFCGVSMFLAGLLGTGIYFNYLNLSPALKTVSFDYYLYYQIVILLLPLYTVLLELVYVDGDELICNLSSVVQIGVNIASSIYLCFRIGIKGVGLGTLLGLVFSIAVLLIHFFRKQNSLQFVWHISRQNVLRVLKCGMTDASAYLFMGLTSFTASKLVIYQFGEHYLPVLLVVFNMIELTIVFDGIGQAVTPVVNVYRGEGNHVGIRRVMKTACKFAIAEGVLLSTVLFFLGGDIAELFGLIDTELIGMSRIAIRLVSPFFFCSGLLFLQTTYYMIIEKEILATAITGVKDWVIPALLMWILGLVFGINGVWIGLGIAPFVSIIAVAVFLLVRYGREKFPLLLEKATREIYIFDTELSGQNIISLRDKVEELLLRKEITRKSINRVMLFIEEVGMLTYENNPGKKVSFECTVMIGDDIQIITRDDGIIHNPTDSDNQVTSFRSYMVANLMLRMQNKQNLITTGYNRNTVRFEK